MKLTAPPKSVLDSCICSLNIFFLCAALSAVAIAQNTIHVPSDVPTIQGAISAANNGDTVLVSPGTYYEAINFSGKAITVTSTDGAAVTIIDGSQMICCFSDVTFNHAETSTSVLSGFTIQNANGTPPQQASGYGIEINGASPTISNNIITNNHGGGGINVDAGSPQILNNTVTNNYGTFGGGIFLNGTAAAAIVQNNYIANNVATNGGGGVGILSYAFPTGSSSLILQNIIVNNASGQNGNSYPSSGGGGIYVQGAQPRVISNTLYGNTSSVGDAGITVYAAPNTVVANNIVTVGSGIAISCGFAGDPSVTFSHNLGYSPSFNSWDPTCASAPGNNGNIGSDARFLDAPNGNYRLAIGSPAFDAGDINVPELPSLDYSGTARLGDIAGQCNFSVDLGVYESHPALPGSLDISPASLTFPDTLVGAISSSQTITLNNTAQGCFRVASYNVTGDFTQSNSCAVNGVPAGQSCTVQASFAPAMTGILTGSFSVLVNSGTAPAPVALSGNGVSRHATAAPSVVNFGNQVVNTLSSPQTLTITNDGGSLLTIYSIAVTGDFAQGYNTCGTALSPGTSCSLQIAFSPSAAGQRSGIVSITTDANPGVPDVPLSGVGLAPAASLAPASLSFALQRIGTSSSAQALSLSNTGTSALNISSIAANGAFNQTNDCPAALAAGNSCSITVTFHPTATGAANGSIILTDDSGGGTGSSQSVALSGTGGSSIAGVSPSSLTFATTKVGTSSAGSIATLNNTGTMSLNVSSISVSGDFSQTNNCPASIVSGGSCQITITFTPAGTGSRTGTLTINDDSQTGNVQTVSLSGTGAVPTAALTPGSLTFPTTDVGIQSASSAVTLTNTGAVSLNVTSISATGDFTQTNNCSSTLTAGASCTINVSFIPTGSGIRTGAVTVSDDAPGGSLTASLTGSATDFNLTASPTSVGINAGQAATYNVTAHAVGGAYNQSISFSCSGLPAGAACTFNPVSVIPGNTSKNIQVKINTQKNVTSKGSYAIIVNGMVNNIARSVTLTLIVK